MREPLEIVKLLTKLLNLVNELPNVDEIKKKVGVVNRKLLRTSICIPYPAQFRIVHISNNETLSEYITPYKAKRICIDEKPDGVVFLLDNFELPERIVVIPRNTTVLELYRSYRTLEENIEQFMDALSNIENIVERAKAISKYVGDTIEILKKVIEEVKNRGNS